MAREVEGCELSDYVGVRGKKQGYLRICGQLVIMVLGNQIHDGCASGLELFCCCCHLKTILYDMQAFTNDT